MTLKDRARTFVVAAIRYIAAHDGFTRGETDTWVRTGDHFIRHTWDRLVYRPEVSFQTLRLPEFGAFLQELLNDRSLGQFIRKYVGSSAGMGTVLHEMQLLNGLLPTDTDPVNPRVSLAFDEADFALRFNALRAIADTSYVPYVQLRPLIGLVCDGTVNVEPGLTIEPMTDGEITEMLAWGVLPTQMNQYREFRPEPGVTHAMKRRYNLPRVVLDAPPTVSETSTDHSMYFNDADDLAHALSILAKGRVTIGPTFLSSTMGWPYGIHTILQPTAFADDPRGLRDMQIPPNAGREMGRIWSALRASGAAYRLAARRFYQGHTRTLVVDMLLDDMISAEALFLYPHAPRKSQTLALNACYYPGEINQRERQRIFALFRDAYRLRSAIVHGEEVDPTRVPMNGTTATLIEFEEAIENELRKAFRKMIDQGESATTIDWSRIVLDSHP